MFIPTFYFIIRTIFYPAFDVLFCIPRKRRTAKPAIKYSFWNAHIFSFLLKSANSVSNEFLQNIKFAPMYKAIINKEFIIPAPASFKNEYPLKVSAENTAITSAKTAPFMIQRRYVLKTLLISTFRLA